MPEMDKNNRHVSEGPSQSPDLMLVHHVWQDLEIVEHSQSEKAFFLLQKRMTKMTFRTHIAQVLVNMSSYDD